MIGNRTPNLADISEGGWPYVYYIAAVRQNTKYFFSGIDLSKRLIAYDSNFLVIASSGQMVQVVTEKQNVIFHYVAESLFRTLLRDKVQVILPVSLVNVGFEQDKPYRRAADCDQK
ncbi:MAG: hypothetical protein JXM70_13410 [Pirellulales bacterium]|nr:hypothetical protein [Pirellulales bacterium]